MKKTHPTRFYDFETARRLVKAESLYSVASFRKWYKHNMPARIPVNPQITYKKEGWKGWNDFLGNNNIFAPKYNFRSFNDAKRFVRSLGIKSYQEWMKWVKTDAKPDDIPARPDHYYKEWFTWKDWLGTDTSIRTILKEVSHIKILLYIAKSDIQLSNVFKVNITYGGQEAILKLRNTGIKIIRIFEFDDRVDWKEILKKYATEYWKGEEDDYVFQNLHQFISELSYHLNDYRWQAS